MLVADIVTSNFTGVALCVLIVITVVAMMSEIPRRPRKNMNIVAPNSKVTCSVCNDQGTINGRQCSCQLAKYWREKC